jgi:hypothetical protein
LVGSLLHSDDLGEWERLFGLPKWLALALDGLLVSALDVQRGVAAGIALLEAIPVGVDVRAAGNRFLWELLEGTKDGLIALLPTGGLADVLHKVAALHWRRLKDAEIAPEEWRQTRRQALALTDTLDKGSPEAAIGACIEAAAWDPATSRTVVSDTCRCWIGVMSQAAAARQSNWTPEDDARIHALLGRLHADAKAKAGDGGGGINAFKLLEQQQPQEATRFKAHLALQQTEYAVQWQRAVDCLQRVLAGEGRVALAIGV